MWVSDRATFLELTVNCARKRKDCRVLEYQTLRSRTRSMNRISGPPVATGIDFILLFMFEVVLLIHLQYVFKLIQAIQSLFQKDSVIYKKTALGCFSNQEQGFSVCVSRFFCWF